MKSSASEPGLRPFPSYKNSHFQNEAKRKGGLKQLGTLTELTGLSMKRNHVKVSSRNSPHFSINHNLDSDQAWLTVARFPELVFISDWRMMFYATYIIGEITKRCTCKRSPYLSFFFLFFFDWNCSSKISSLTWLNLLLSPLSTLAAACSFFWRHR